MPTASRGYVQPDTRTTTTSEAMSKVLDMLDGLNEYDYQSSRYVRDQWVRGGADALSRALAPIEADIFDHTTPTGATRHAALDLLIALENGLTTNDARTYAVDRAKVTPLIEDMLAAIVLGKVKFETEDK